MPLRHDNTPALSFGISGDFCAVTGAFTVIEKFLSVEANRSESKMLASGSEHLLGCPFQLPPKSTLSMTMADCSRSGWG